MLKLQLLSIILSLLIIPGCTSDPSKNDLKSPCVAIKNDKEKIDPCTWSLPAENSKFV